MMTLTRASGPTRRAAAVAALAVAALLAAAPAAAKFDPARRWRTAETPHFTVHFPEGYDELAGRAAAIAEEAHEALAPRVGWEPRSRTQLILSDDTDVATGWSTPYPYNQILVSAAAPSGGTGLGATRFDDWLRLAITHEYAHTLQLDMASRLPLALRSVFGRLYFPNALQPQWLIEGLATLEETELTAGGRGRSPGDEMVLRMAALEGPFPRLDEMAVFPDAWPSGQVPYLFGESFLRHLSGRFGRAGVAALSQAYGGRPLPFLVESTGRDVLGESYRDLWREWQGTLTQRFAEQQRAVAARGATVAEPLTDSGHRNGAPSWSPDGSLIAWLSDDGREPPGLWVMKSDGSEPRRLVASAALVPASVAAPGWSPDGRRLYYAKLGYFRGAVVASDVWEFDLDRGREIPLTSGLRARDPDPSPDGRTLVAVVEGRGRTRLALLPIDRDRPLSPASTLRLLVEPTQDQIAHPRWSPDGRRVAFSVRGRAGEEIRVIDLNGRLVGGTGRRGALNAGPAWSADGRFVYFSSDRTGIFNVFAWSPETGEVRQVTNVIGGAFSPAPAPDGRRLAFLDYSARGYDIRVLDLGTAAVAGPAPAPSSPAGPATAQPGSLPAGGQALASRPYSPAGTIAPRLWFPWVAASEASGTLAGFVTGGQDALQRHRYTVSVLYGPEEGRLMHAASYAYDGWRPTFRLLSWDLDATFADLLRDDGASADYTERVRGLGAEASLALPGFDASHALTLGYRHRDLSALTALEPWPGYEGDEPVTGSLGSTRLAWSYSSARRQPFSISLEDGQQVELGVERFQRGLGSELSFTTGTLDWRGYHALGDSRHVIAARAFLGVATGHTPVQGAFRLGGEAPGDIGATIDDRMLSLRGYPQNAFRGRRAALAGLEYRFPLLELGRGGVSAPFYLRRLHGALFVDAGEAWHEGGFSAWQLKTGVGAELRLDLTFSYFVPLTVHLGIASGLDEEGGVYPTLGIRIPQSFAGTATDPHRR